MKKRVKNALIPHEGNDYRPHALRPKVVGGVIAALVVCQLIFLFATTNIIPRSKLFGIIEVNALTDGTNQARTSDQLPALTMSPLLQAAAQEKVNDMVMKNYFAHTSPAGITPWYWFINVGYNFSYAGENLAVNFSDSQDVTNAWLNSPEHRANILDTNFTQIGIATAEGTYEGQPATYVVELFGTPAVAGTPIVNLAKAATPRGIATISSSPLGGGQGGGLKSITSNSKNQPSLVALNSSTTGTEPITVAVKGAQTTAAAQSITSSPLGGGRGGGMAIKSLPPVTTTAVAATAPATVAAPTPQNNIIQTAFANPVSSVDDIYYLILAFFILALGLNIFIKIRVQHPDLILGGLVTIALVGIFIVANQQALLSVVIK